MYTVDSATDRAEPAYQAEVVAVDGYLDLAALRIIAYADGVPLEPADLDLPAVTIGSAATLRPLDDLVVAGYPGIAETFAVRFTRGELNNFSESILRVGRDAWLHTDAKTFAAGNSGRSGGRCWRSARGGPDSDDQRRSERGHRLQHAPHRPRAAAHRGREDRADV